MNRRTWVCAALVGGISGLATGCSTRTGRYVVDATAGDKSSITVTCEVGIGLHSVDGKRGWLLAEQLGVPRSTRSDSPYQAMVCNGSGQENTFVFLPGRHRLALSYANASVESVGEEPIVELDGLPGHRYLICAGVLGKAQSGEKQAWRPRLVDLSAGESC